MDPIAPTTDDAAPTSAADPNDLARTRATTGPAPAPAPDDAAADSAAPVVEGGTLAEVESLRGVLITSSGDAEVEALRRSLELDDQPEAAAPTNDEQAEYADILRQEVTAPPPNADRAGDDRDGEVPGDPDGPPLDPTEAFEVHDAAVAGDAIAQAIEDASRQRTATAEATINRTREERTQADAALERRQAL
ncbi:MAG: hypothetical protein JWM98_2347, partial [Thermoleophilia bacterium]|nr:hypothetical protein [Thermoleophilia bacterium]